MAATSFLASLSIIDGLSFHFPSVVYWYTLSLLPVSRSPPMMRKVLPQGTTAAYPIYCGRPVPEKEL